MSCRTCSVASRRMRSMAALSGRAFPAIPRDIDRRRPERAVHQVADRTNLLKRRVGENRLCDLQSLVRAGREAQQVWPRPDHRHQRHDQLFADRIDRRVGHLGEVLLEIVVEQLRLAREHCDRRIRAHRSNRVVALPWARGRTAGLPACSRTPAGDRAGSPSCRPAWRGPPPGLGVRSA